MEGPDGLLELDGPGMRVLLAELDERLRQRGVAASIYVVGGAAMALAYGREGVTPDIDALATHRAVAEEAEAMTESHGLAAHWLNDSVSPWIPPRPKDARRRPTQPGLIVHIAPPEHVLAMKLVALRRKDRPDIRLLMEHLDLIDATAEDFADILEQTYTGEGCLATALGIPGDTPTATRTEALAIGRWAAEFARSLGKRNP